VASSRSSSSSRSSGTSDDDGGYNLPPPPETTTNSLSRIAAYDRSNIDPYPEYEDNLSEAPMSTVEGDDYVATAQVHRAHLSQTSFQGCEWTQPNLEDIPCADNADPEAALASSTLDPTSPPPKAMYTRGFGSAASTAGAAGVGAGAVAGTSRLGTVPEQSPSQNQYMVGAANGRNELVTQERDAGMLFAAASSGPSSPMRERIIPPSYDPAWSSSSPPLPEKGGFVPRPPSESPTDSYSSPGSPDTRASAGTYRHPFF
jgi:hypothetical protein